MEDEKVEVTEVEEKVEVAEPEDEKAGYLRHADYTRKTQELADERREFESRLALLDDLEAAIETSAGRRALIERLKEYESDKESEYEDATARELRELRKEIKELKEFAGQTNAERQISAAATIASEKSGGVVSVEQVREAMREFKTTDPVAAIAQKIAFGGLRPQPTEHSQKPRGVPAGHTLSANLEKAAKSGDIASILDHLDSGG